MDTKVVRHYDNFNDYFGDPNKEDEIEWSPLKLRGLLNNKTRKCRKLVSVGGTFDCPFCNKCFKDGHKFLCLDDDVAPKPSDCTVLSFGIGENWSFDNAMAKFNCSVYAFDMSIQNFTDQIVQENLYFLSLGLWHSDARAEFHLMDKSKQNNTIQISEMRKLETILELLDRQNKKIDFLKMDIESSEWAFFDHIFKIKSKILDKVSQIAIEIHLDDFKNISKAGRDVGGKRYQRVLQNLFKENFHLVNTELNTYAQIFARVRGYIFPLFRESLYIKRE